jgi:hypothetical protein
MVMLSSASSKDLDIEASFPRIGAGKFCIWQETQTKTTIRRTTVD